MQFVIVTNTVAVGGKLQLASALTEISQMTIANKTSAHLYEGIISGLALCANIQVLDPTTLPSLIVISDCYNNPDGTANDDTSELQQALTHCMPMPVSLISLVKSNMGNSSDYATITSYRNALNRLFTDNGGRAYLFDEQGDRVAASATIGDEIKRSSSAVLPVRLDLRPLKQQFSQNAAGKFEFMVSCSSKSGTISREREINLDFNNMPDYDGVTPTPTVSPTPNPNAVFLKQGDTGADVRTMQYRLTELYYMTAIEDSYGIQTQLAVDDFCRRNGFAISDGITYAAYKDLLSKEAIPSPTDTPAPETPEPNGPEDIRLTVGDTGAEVYDVKKRLKALYYYNGELDQKYDDATATAVYDFCDDNGLPKADGLTYGAYEILMYGKDVSVKDTPTPEPTAPPTPVPTPEYADIEAGEASDYALRLQKQLQALGYFIGDAEYKPGILDEATQAAVDLFCSQNSVDASEGVTAELLEMILSSSAKYSPSAVPQPSLSEKLRSFIFGSVIIAGITIPTWALLSTCLVLIILIVVLALLSRDKHHNADVGESDDDIMDGMGKFPNDKITPSLDDAEAPTTGGNIPGLTGDEDSVTEGPSIGTHPVTVQIVYNGSTRVETLLVNGRYSIGRSHTQLKLDATDTSVSRKHCEIFFNGSQLMICDYSTFGTTVDGVRIPANDDSPLNNGAVVNIGRHVLTFRY